MVTLTSLLLLTEVAVPLYGHSKRSTNNPISFKKLIFISTATVLEVQFQFSVVLRFFIYLLVEFNETGKIKSNSFEKTKNQKQFIPQHNIVGFS